MIVFKKLTYKNFLSTGNQETVIYLNKDSSTLVVGSNGAGKSTMLDALSFGLFGKPHRSINKGQLVNSINGKQLLVTVEFSIGPVEYKVIRGVKPAKFEIYQNGKILNQESHARDYQKILESNILKLNHKSFHQVVVLGSSNFIPFMQLNPYNRRNVIEDLLDIKVFTKMNAILKDKYNILKSELKDTEYSIEILNEKIKLKNQHISELRSIDEGKKQELTEDRNALEEQRNSLLEKKKELEQKLQADTPSKVKIDTVGQKKKELTSLEGQIKGKLANLSSHKKFFEENKECPTCGQDISLELKEDAVRNTQADIDKVTTGLGELKAVLEKTETEFEELNDLFYEHKNMSSELIRLNTDITTKDTLIGKLQAKIDKPSEDTSKSEEELNGLNTKKTEAVEEKNEYITQKAYYDALSELLKDTGIKTKIIKEYLPVMNGLINKYLQVLDFFVSFHLDENFDETIKSRHRDEFTYPSFSEGEKQRIDLALLFSWRQIAQMKNSANTNLLILDETFDSSLDADGVDNLFKILATLNKNTNTFVISHKQDILDGRFPAKIEFHKVNNFSKIK